MKEIKTVDELLETDPFAQILHLMCIQGFLWNPCSLAFGVGFAFEDLLSELQSTFPESNWISTDLESFLALGIAQGLFKQLHDAPDALYFANQNLLNMNPKNWIYEELCPLFCAKKQCKAPSSLGGTFCTL